MTTNLRAEDELLAQFERDTIPAHFRAFYAAKRHNLFANVQGFKALFDGFMLLDKILMREFDDMMTGVPPSTMFPILMFVNAHAKMRIALELGFSSCIPDAHSIVRDAIESVAHGHRMYSDPERVIVWLKKGEDQAATDAFHDEFWAHKGTRLFDGLPELFKSWKKFSEFGSHTNMNSLLHRFDVQESPDKIRWQLNYTGVEPKRLLGLLYEMFLLFCALQEVVFKDCAGRLELDVELGDMRNLLHRETKTLHRRIKELMGTTTA